MTTRQQQVQESVFPVSTETNFFLLYLSFFHKIISLLPSDVFLPLLIPARILFANIEITAASAFRQSLRPVQPSTHMVHADKITLAHIWHQLLATLLPPQFLQTTAMVENGNFLHVTAQKNLYVPVHGAFDGVGASGRFQTLLLSLFRKRRLGRKGQSHDSGVHASRYHVRKGLGIHAAF